MKRVLRRLGFTDKNNVVQLKGRVACEVNAGAQELLVVELIFNNVFSDLSVPQIAALLVSKIQKAKRERVQSRNMESNCSLTFLFLLLSFKLVSLSLSRISSISKNTPNKSFLTQ